MTLKILINDLLQWKSPDDKPRIERITWIDVESASAFLFDINANKGFPYSRPILEVEEALSHQQATKIEADPWATFVRESDLSEKEKQIRNRAWQIIYPLILKTPAIYYRESRGQLVQEAIAKFNRDNPAEKLIAKTVYAYLRKFWQRGQIQNALLPDYIFSGGRGKRREVGASKRGRPRKYKECSEIGEGINITERDRHIFRLAIRKFYLNPTQNSLTTAYKLAIKNYYAEGFEVDENNIRTLVLIPPEKRPTFAQFKYWYETENSNCQKNLSARRGAKRFALENRAILGTSKQEAIGPGSRYQVDSTVGDVYLVSRYNSNWIIGRPVIYCIIDVFSRAIAGMYVGLEGPSWVGAMMALVNAASDKVSFCQEFGISITEEQWPCRHIPECVLGDRGELVGMTSDNIIANLDIRVENAALYRPDWKGLVERSFGMVRELVKPFVPGFVQPDFRERGAKDYRLESCLNIDQLTEILIEIVLSYNSQPLASYNRDEMAIAGYVPPIPLELWKWGQSHRLGKLRTVSEDILKLNLMPRDRATVTERGIRFNSMHYTCERAIAEMWFARARSKMLSQAEKYLEIAYDPRCLDFIYLPSIDGKTFDKCFLIDADEIFRHKSLDEVNYLQEYEKLQQKKAEGAKLQQQVNLYDKIEAIVRRARECAEVDLDHDSSNCERVAKIRENRNVEKDLRREKEAFALDVGSEPPPEKEIPTPEEMQEPAEFSPFDYLMQKRQERRNGRTGI